MTNDYVVTTNGDLDALAKEIVAEIYRYAAFDRFARIMENVYRALRHKERKALLIRQYESAQRYESWFEYLDGFNWTRRRKAEASLEWSRRVREGVKALPPPGPRVYCQTEED